MRPVRLTLQAFGPYAGREVIDFRSAVEAGLFGIYGQTGSGKSTIFSGMTFALFGEASRSEQERTSLRSDHAAASLLTEVEFVFDVGERRFVIVRQPDQMRPKKRGSGATLSPHEAYLFEATGLSPDSIIAGKRGKVLAEKKVRDVDAAVSDILGYGAEQFRQIVLLPQGRFEKFLSAKTTERLGILRDLFDVSLYQAMMADLADTARQAELEVREERAVCSGRLKAEGFESTEALLDGIKVAEAAVRACCRAEADARSTAKAAEAELRSAETAESRFIEAERAQAQLAALSARKAEMASLADSVRQAERARMMVDLEQHMIAARREATDAERKRVEAAEAQDRARQSAEAAAEALTKEESRAPEIEAARKRKDDLERYAAVLDAASASAEAVEATGRAEQTAHEALENSKRQLQTLRNARERRTAALKLARTTEARRSDLKRTQSDLLAQKAAAELHETARADVAAAQEAVRVGTQALADASAREAAAREAFEAAEQAHTAAQALHLAEKLEDGTPCPVCGSVDHPAPATGEIANLGVDKAFRDRRDRLQRAERAAREAGETLAGSKAMLAEREARLSSLAPPVAQVSTLADRLRQAGDQLEALGPAVDLDAAEAAMETLERQVADLEAESERRRTAFEACRNAATEARATRDGKLADVPEPLRHEGALASELAKAQQSLQALVAGRQQAEERVRSTREAMLSAGAELKSAEQALESCKMRRDKASDDFLRRLAELGLTSEAYQSLKPSIAMIEENSALVRDFETRLNEAQGVARAATSAIDGLARPDLPGVQAKHAAASAALAEATEARIAATSRVEQLEQLRQSLEETMRRLDEAEAKSGPLRKVAALANGDNPFKLNLETFAIGAMFDRVLEAANLRLGPMTSSRYQLERDTEGGRGRRGLGIQVFDVHTGKSRGTDTLSGGETFIAALALALGLADVVESASGKVRLETIFIDEGFGSLDTENGSGTLDQVLQVLNSLVRQSRAVGLISHVPMVQEAIPNGFYVRKGLTGSTVEERGAV